LLKPEVREVARSLGLATADKPESQEICFVPGGDYRDALRDRAGWQPVPGPVLDVDGTRVGEHRGAAGYTVGQRQGLGVALGAPRYVSTIDPVTNTIQLGRREDLETHTFTVERTSFIAPGAPDATFRADVRIRHRAQPVPASMEPLGDRRWAVTTATPVWAAAPGQAAVFYDGDEVLGGGRIGRRDPVSAQEPRALATSA
jgi:tRNA-specific 2-thiouridylase